MNSWLTQHRYALLVTLRRLSVQPFSSFANIVVISLALSLPLLGVCVLISIQPLARQVSITPEITIFLKPGASEGLADKIANRIRNEYADASSQVRVVPKDKALSDLKSNPAWDQVLKALPNNPLPDAVIVSLKQSADAAGNDIATRSKSLAKAWGSWEGVDLVQLDREWVQRLEAILRFANIGLSLLGLSVGLVVLATVFNTVRLQAITQRDEIAVARLVGATEAFVRRPFVYLGAITCGLSSLVAILVAWVALIPLNKALARLAHSYQAEFSIHLLPATPLTLAALAVAALGSLSAHWSVNRHTQF